ncbi:hypothetical protein G6F53_014131 [Rhizopus delemar]|nr:hypothetical protein G6F53_014131 [Rhizopus delemar]
MACHGGPINAVPTPPRKQGEADAGQQYLDDDEETAPVQDVGQHAGGDGQQENRQGGGSLHHGDGGGVR